MQNFHSSLEGGWRKVFIRVFPGECGDQCRYCRNDCKSGGIARKFPGESA
jgi:hypothetical protein